jgi:O-antigen ligase
MELNKTDAGSLYIRIASEFGIPGLLAIAWFLVKYKLKTGGETYPYRAINDMCFIYLVMYGTRTGNYLETSLWLFAALYYYSFVLERKRRLHGVNQMWRGLHSKKARPKHNGIPGLGGTSVAKLINPR